MKAIDEAGSGRAEPDHRRPLARYGGARPPAPRWFADAMAAVPARHVVENEDAAIEYLVWGEPGAPGLLLTHGGGAHAMWWAHIAPFFAATHRVAALSLAGMGGSSWRERYSIDQHARDLRAVADAAGLFAAGAPVIAGHSFGGAPTVTAAAEGWPGLAIAIDSSIDMRPAASEASPFADTRERTAFDSLEQGLARFRFLPTQPCENDYIADMIARESLVELNGKWSWRFDPDMFRRIDKLDSREQARNARCPLAIVYGERSLIVTPDILDGLRAGLSGGTPFVGIPDSGHHVMVDQPLALVAALRALIAENGRPA